MFNRYQNLFLALLLFPLTLSAQQPFPVTIDGPVWRTVEDYFFDPGVFQNVWSMTADTQMCAENYSVAEPSILNSFWYGYRKAYVRNQGAQVLYRTDTACNAPERLMYDFGLSVGDTFFTDVNVGQDPYTIDSTPYIVDSITTVTFNGISRRKFNLSQPQGTGRAREWLEGIGDLIHPFYTLVGQGTEFDMITLCYDSLGTQLYQNPQFGTCSLVVSITEPLRESVQVYPNPSSTGTFLEAAEGTEIQEIQLFDLSGKLIYQVLTAREKQIYIPPQKAKGIYLLKVHTTAGVLNEQLIQQ